VGGGTYSDLLPCEPLIISLVPSYMLRIRYIYSSMNVQIDIKALVTELLLKMSAILSNATIFPFLIFKALGIRRFRSVGQLS